MLFWFGSLHDCKVETVILVTVGMGGRVVQTHRCQIKQGTNHQYFFI